MSIFLETERLLVKTIVSSDFAHLIALRTDPDVMRYIGEGKIQTKEEIQQFLMMAVGYQQRYGYGFCSVFKKQTKQFIGQAGLFHLGFDDTQAEIEIAYRLHQHAWGKGYATELVRALIAWGFQNLAVERLIALVHPDNDRSRRVLEKAGLMAAGKVRYGDTNVPCYAIYKNDAIELTPYDPQWPLLAQAELTRLYQTLPSTHIVDMQHVGSTAIVNMMAKPIIDIQIAVDSLAKVKPQAIAALESLGYQYWDNNPDPERLFFAKGMPPFGKKRTHHVHIVQRDSKHWHAKLFFRDYLRQHQTAASDYQQLKISLAQQYPYDREQYTSAKLDFINEILAQGLTALPA